VLGPVTRPVMDGGTEIREFGAVGAVFPVGLVFADRAVVAVPAVRDDVDDHAAGVARAVVRPVGAMSGLFALAVP
jgi:hypothetical protein